MQIKLGLRNKPDPIHLYVRKKEDNGNDYCWYYYDVEKQISTPEYQPALCGYLSNLRITNKDYKGKDTPKLDIVMECDDTYIIRTGIETYFAKTFLLAIAEVQDFSKPIIVYASLGKENVVFCRICDAETKTKIKPEWNPEADWAAIIANVQFQLNQPQPQSTFEVTTPPTLLPPTSFDNQARRDALIAQSDKLIEALGWTKRRAQEYVIQTYKKSLRSELTDAELIDFVGKLQKMPLPVKR
ncbi:hypothetical protein FD723_40560 (plasmid) [Nostoc sp. C052]|uniref:hypothetical protein n=1 Tax=Nostoc sp. C052 TaxID=2576902 RepID=UPI0015C37885|nr:hypothetical protein [Nostoc sp. C052]QLE46507.1 hypothetical protein FD723_40560 [Nostoc sp. C052]